MLPGTPQITLALATFLALSSTAVAAESYNLGDLLRPGYEGYDVLSDVIRGFLPHADPYIDVFDALVGLVRDYTYQVIVGLTDGDAGSSAGTPDAVGLDLPSIVIAERAAVPGVDVSFPSRTIPLGTPPVSKSAVTPAVRTPPVHASFPGFTIPVVVPGASTPAIPVDVPPQRTTTPPVTTPHVRIQTPQVDAPPGDVTLEWGSVGVYFAGVRGTVYAGPVVVPYSVPETDVRADDALPAGAPRSATVEKGDLASLPPRTVVDEGSRTLLPSQTVETPGFREDVPSQRLTDPVPVGSVTTQPASVSIPSVEALPAQRIDVSAPGTSLGSVTIPGAGVRSRELVIHDEAVATPGIEQEVPTPLPVDGLGYFGYGKEKDSSFYPYACGPVVGCVHSSWFAERHVDAADATLDALAAYADGPIVISLGPQFER